MRLPTTAPRLPTLSTFFLLSLASAATGQVDVLTNRYDSPRTGANLNETRLNATTVTGSQFGKLYSYPVDGPVYAQPLYLENVLVNGVRRNVLYVATMNDKVYAFDADSASPAPLWMRDFTSPPSITPVPITDIVGPDLNIVGNVGIHSTPVIDPVAGTIYLVARTKENGDYVQRLHALDITTGASRAGSPVTITASVSGTAPDAVGGVLTFNPKMQSQRPALALANGVVLIAWAGHEDKLPYHGWVIGYDAASLARVAVFCSSPDTNAAGIWQGGRGPTIDAAGNVYFVTGNGGWDGARNFGNSLLKFSVSSTAGLTLLDYFTPGNQAALTADDNDLSGSSFTLLPETSLLLGGGKEGVLYLIASEHLGHMAPNDGQIVQRIPAAGQPVTGGHVMGGPVYWKSETVGPIIYDWKEDDVLRAYRVAAGRLETPDFLRSAVVSPGHPGGSLTLSANGGAAGSGVVWAYMPATETAKHGLHLGILRAYDAETLNEIWNSEQTPTRDRVGNLMKFVPPLVENGRVYIPNHNNAVVVYGLLPRAVAPGDIISVDFTGTGVAMGASEVAGVVPKANWNSAPGAASSGALPLVNDSGVLTTAKLSWSAPGGTAITPIADQPGSARMMKGYLDAGDASTTSIFVSNLRAQAYDVYVYVDGDNKTVDRSASYRISGTGITTTTINLTDAANTDFTSSFTRADNSRGNYLKFTITAAAFNLQATATGPADGARRAPINGLQIVPSAPPEEPHPAGDGAIGIDFVGTTATDMAAGETAGVVPAANWNSAAGAASASALALVDDSGAATTATVTWASAGGWMLPIADQPGNARMMKGYLDTTSTSTTTVTVTGLIARAYDVYVYADGDNKVYDRSAAYTISGPGITTATVTLTDPADTNFGSAFTRADGSPGNYVKFSINATGFTLQATPGTATTATRRAPINGIQIVPAPPPDFHAFGIDFVGSATAMAPAESAGVVAKTHWNSAAGASSTTPLGLVDDTGILTAATVTWSANGNWMTPIADGPGNARLMKGYLDTSSTSVTTVTVAGLPQATYDVYVYVDGDNKNYDRSASYRISGPGITASAISATDVANVNFTGTFTQASNGSGNYVKFRISGSGFTLTATPGTGTNPTLRAPVNAIQIVPVS